MNTQICTDVSIQAAKPKAKSAKRDNTADEASFASQLQKRINGVNNTQKSEKGVEKPEQPADKEIKDDDDQTVPEGDGQSAVQVQIIAAFAAVPFVPPAVVVPASDDAPATQVQPADMPIAAAEAAQASLQQPEQAQAADAMPYTAQLAQTGEEPVMSLAGTINSFGAQLQAQVSTTAETSSGQGEDTGAQQQGTPQHRAALTAQTALDGKSAAVRPSSEAKIPTDAGQPGTFAGRLGDLGLSIKTASAASDVFGQTPAPPSQQVATAVLNAYQSGKTEFAMKLEPDMLGELTVKMVMEQGRLSVSIAAANGQTAKLIEGQMTELRAALKENNIQMETCTVENQSYNDLASGGSFSMFGGQTDDRPQRTQRLVIEKIPEEQQNAIEQLNVMRATSILNCYV